MTKQLLLQKVLINDLTFLMPQHTSSEVTVGYNTIRFKCVEEEICFYSQDLNAKEKDCNLI